MTASTDKDTREAAAAEIESYLDGELQSGRLDDRTREALIIACEVLRADHGWIGQRDL